MQLLGVKRKSANVLRVQMSLRSLARPLAKGSHRTKPTDEWQRAFLAHVRNTGQPEIFPDIERYPPPEGSRPYILCRFDVDRKKRPERDMAPCAMCSPFHEKCLEGLCLVWYEDEGVVRVIGPECGNGLDGGALLNAERKAFDRRQRQMRAETFLENNLPRISAWIAALNELRPALAEAERLHHKFRHDYGAIAKKFRHIKNQAGGMLAVSIEIAGTRTEKQDDGTEQQDRGERIGPKGFGKGPDAVDTYTEEFGVLDGATMFAASFEPIADLDGLMAIASALPELSSVEDTFDWICEHESLEFFEQIIEQVRRIQAGFNRLVQQADSVIAFFSLSHFDRLNTWGTHPEANFRLEATHAQGVFTLEHDARRARMKPDFEALAIRPAWLPLRD